MREARCDQDHRRNAALGFCRTEGVNAGERAGHGVDAANNLGKLPVLGLRILDADHDDERTALIVNRVDGLRQRAARADQCSRLTAVDEHGGVERERDFVRVGGGADQSDDGRADGLDRPGAAINDDSLDAVKEIGKGHLFSQSSVLGLSVP